MTTRLEQLKPDAMVQGLVGREVVRIVSAEMLGEAACKVVYRGQDGVLGEQLLFRSSEAELELVGGGRKWSFAGSGDLFRLVSEATRIQLAYLFDPYVAVSSSTIDPLPIRSVRCTSTCSPASRCASCWPTTQVPARRSWPAC